MATAAVVTIATTAAVTTATTETTQAQREIMLAVAATAILSLPGEAVISPG